jgi:hypothetical protein
LSKYFYIGIVSCIFYVSVEQPVLAENYSSNAEYDSPGDISERKGSKISDDLRKNASDKVRWGSFSLNSSDTDPNALKLVLIKDAGFTMHLDPKEDHLFFEKPGTKQVFAIQGPSDNDGVCPSYNIRVIDASATHVVIEQNCHSHDPSPGKMRISSDYYLYDMKTASMIDFWRSGIEVKKVPLSFVRPDPIVTKLHEGYEIDWKYSDITSNPVDKLNMHNIYHYMTDRESRKVYLNCSDLTNKQRLDGDLCERGGDLEAIVK